MQGIPHPTLEAWSNRGMIGLSLNPLVPTVVVEVVH